ncbi:glycerophosphoryl diester phosphodiesterase membrane domain-containing protein [uncultured Sphingomonas sp.]|uniref:glycerophosphoryl diester phosphodiesterase membrane domain-containing protein n=1 Tax=uncultured Sphingomonas sp. TaxID=158754 RepID=UPI0025DE8BFB|nr:glycerophosphoryl diester phosphodiesterase membrane domain-containing protein [uncultured Sphingomonas sp.]
MAALSISRAWDDTRACLRRDGRLYATVALALFVVPGVIAELVTPAAPAGQLPTPGYWTGLSMLALLISLIGQLAVCRLALGPAISVGQAIRHGVRRAPAYVAAAIIWILPFLLLFALLAARVGANPQTMSAGVALAMLALLVAFVAVAVRLILASPIATAEPLGPLGILKRSWSLTRGRWLKLFGCLLLFVIALLIAMFAVSAIIGLLATLLLGEIEPLSVGALLLSLATQIVGAIVTTLLMIMLARIYAQLVGTGQGAYASVPQAP